MNHDVLPAHVLCAGGLLQAFRDNDGERWAAVLAEQTAEDTPVGPYDVFVAAAAIATVLTNTAAEATGADPADVLADVVGVTAHLSAEVSSGDE